MDGMSPARHAAIRRGARRGLDRLTKTRLSRWPVLGQPPSLLWYLVAVTGADIALAGWELTRTAAHPGQVVLFAGLLACGAVCIETTRRLGMPAGVSRDLLSAWWLPVALLLPPLYALLAPVPISFLLQLRVRRAPAFRRVFSAAVLGLAGAGASVAFRILGARIAGAAPLGRPQVWLTYPAMVAAAVACAVFFTIVNVALVAVAANIAERRAPARGFLWDKESLLLDLAELCLGVLVTIACVASPALLLVALPPVVVLQRSLQHKQLRAAARIDAKTGLLNIAAWQREAGVEIGKAVRGGEPLALLLIDIDHFKRVNDTCGHLAGDQVLAGLSAALRVLVRETDIVGRFGGEEFVALLPRANIAEARLVAERVRARISEMRVPVEDTTVTVTVSIGMAMLGHHGHDLFELLAAADLALYRAKESGRDRVCLFTRVDTEAARLSGQDEPEPGIGAA
ncbi:MAG TPA: GGDEF domain-containing protein [Streptosporangiaceae bacterium]|nr:GGDEF domain-containing protein [Streptosporangiaceae bacterium]